MIDPHQITNFQRTRAELEEFLLFAVLVAGKRADQQALKLEAFLQDVSSHVRVSPHATPFEKLRRLYVLDSSLLMTLLKKHKIGQYNRIYQCICDLMKYVNDIEHVTLSCLESCRGIGGKTARFFWLHSRSDARVAVLDTHILSFLREELGIANVPKSTPSNPATYRRLEQSFLTYCELKNSTVAEIDLEIWKSRTKSSTIA